MGCERAEPVTSYLAKTDSSKGNVGLDTAIVNFVRCFSPTTNAWRVTSTGHSYTPVCRCIGGEYSGVMNWTLALGGGVCGFSVME